MVADNDSVEEHVAQRIRGRGALGKLPRSAEIQDEFGRMVAEALTAYWATHAILAAGGAVPISARPDLQAALAAGLADGTLEVVG